MSANQFTVFQYIPALLVLINDAQATSAAASGKDKKAAVLKEFEDGVQVVAPFLKGGKYAVLISDTVDYLVKVGQDYEAILAAEPVIVAPPAPAPPPPPPLPIVSPPVPTPPPVVLPPVVVPPPPAPPTTPSTRGVWNTGSIPSDADLKAKGFSVGEWKWTAYDASVLLVAWAVTPSGGTMARGNYFKLDMLGAIS